MPKLPTISIQSTRRLAGEPSFYVERDRGPLWRQHCTTIRVLDLLIFIERRPSAEELAADHAGKQAEIAADFAARGLVYDPV